jgi:hypothetical protein
MRGPAAAAATRQVKDASLLKVEVVLNEHDLAPASRVTVRAVSSTVTCSYVRAGTSVKAEYRVAVKTDERALMDHLCRRPGPSHRHRIA